MKSARDNVEVSRSTGERICQGLGASLAVGLAAYVGWMWRSLPARIPSHFGFNGQPDAWSDSRSFLILPALGLGFFVALSLLERVPHLYNYPLAITDTNRQAAYRLGRQTVLAVKTLLVALFAYVTIGTVQTALGHLNGFGTWFIPLLLVGVVLSVGVCIVRFMRLRDRYEP